MKPAPRIAPRLLRQMTVRRVLDLLRERGPSSRADLVRLSGISAPTISKAVASLLEAGLLDEGDAPTGALGRPGRLLRLANRTARVLGVVLDAATIEVVAAGLDGVLFDELSTVSAMPASYAALLDTLADRLTPLLGGDTTTLGIGLSTPGLTDHGQQTVVLSPNLPMTNGRSPARDLELRLGVPCFLVQESHALCLAEQTQGAARGTADFAMVDASAGLGLGIVNHGALLLGHRGFAGELGHLTVEPNGLLCGCGNRGCLETRATDAALIRDVSARLGRAVTIDDVVHILRFATHDLDAEIDRVTTWLAVAIAGVINVFNPAELFVHAKWPTARPELFTEVVTRARGRALWPSERPCGIELTRVTKAHGAIAGGLRGLIDTHVASPRDATTPQEA